MSEIELILLRISLSFDVQSLQTAIVSVLNEPPEKTNATDTSV